MAKTTTSLFATPPSQVLGRSAPLSRSLFTPRWIAAHLTVVVLAVVFTYLGFWQLRRLDEVQTENLVLQNRLNLPAEDFYSLLDQAGSDVDAIAFRRVIVSGNFAAEDEVLVRSQVFRDNAGFHVVTPLVSDDGRGVLVNRGWVPLEMDTIPSPASPPDGAVQIQGWIEVSKTRPPTGPRDPAAGRIEVVSRIDVPRIQQQVDLPLAPIYLVLDDEQGSGLPIPLAQPVIDDEGPHLAYAIQWFSFAAIGLVGYWSLMRKPTRRSVVAAGKVGDDLESVDSD